MNPRNPNRLMLVAAAPWLISIPAKTELWYPVSLPGQTRQQSPDEQAISAYARHARVLGNYVNAFLELSDNWDGYGAVPPSSRAIDNAVDVLTQLPGEWTSRLRQDDIKPSTYGTITLEWQTDASGFAGLEIGDETWAFFGEVSGQALKSSLVPYPSDRLLAQAEATLQTLYFGSVMPAYAHT